MSHPLPRISAHNAAGLLPVDSVAERMGLLQRILDQDCTPVREVQAKGTCFVIPT